MLPMREAGQEDLLQIAEHRLEALGPLGGRARQLTLDLAGGGAGHHRAVCQCRPVIGNPVDQPVAVGAELVRRHRILRFLRSKPLQAGDVPVREAVSLGRSHDAVDVVVGGRKGVPARELGFDAEEETAALVLWRTSATDGMLSTSAPPFSPAYLLAATVIV